MITQEFLDNLLSNDLNLQTTRIYLLADFELFIKIVYPALNGGENFIFSPAILPIIKALEKISFGINAKRNLGICLPPGAGKSEIVKLWLAWNYCRDKNYAFLYLSHSDSMITKRSKEIKDILTDPFIYKLYGLELKNDEKSKINWSFKDSMNRSGLYAASIRSGLTGLDAGRGDSKALKEFSGALIIDDPMNAGDAHSEIERQNVIDLYVNTLKSRKRSPIVPTILIMQRLHKEDLVGYVLEYEKEDWDIINVSALDEYDNSFWPSRFPASDLIKLRESATGSELFWAQYQQNPILAEGELIKKEWFRYYISYKDIKFNKIFFVADTAMKIKEHNDYSVFLCCGISEGNLYILDMKRGKWEAPDLKQEVLNFWNLWKNGIGLCRTGGFHIEDKSSGIGLIQDLGKSTGIPVIPINVDTEVQNGKKVLRDKVTRVQGILDYIQAGRVLLPQDRPDIVSPLLAECSAFRRDNTHKHDDIVDCLVYGIEIGLIIRKVSLFDI